jgi:hypothetical protein
MVWVLGNETDTGFAQPPSTAPPASATTAPAASTVVPGCLLITWIGRTPGGPVRRAASSMEAPGPSSSAESSVPSSTTDTGSASGTSGASMARSAVAPPTAGSGHPVQPKVPPGISGLDSMPLAAGALGHRRVLSSWVSAPRITWRDSSPGRAS